MRELRSALLLTLVVACGAKSNPSICDQVGVTSNPICNQTCNASPGAPTTCPAGYHCDPGGKCDAQCDATHACSDGFNCNLADGTCTLGDQCQGLACNVTKCDQMGMPPTSISGTVFAPNGTLPLFDISVYIPNTDPGAFSDVLACSNCNDGLPGNPIVQTTTDEHGHFSLTNIPNGDNIPVVITIGKWRRQLVIPHVAACVDAPIATADTTLPKSLTDASPATAKDAMGKPKVDMPKIAISTGSADSLECLVRRLGIADSEITSDAGAGHVKLFADLDANGVGAKKFDAGFGGGGNFGDSQTKLWGNANSAGSLASFDIVILSCEGEQDANTKPQEAMDHLKSYADLGGRVFMSHWHNVWIEGSTQDTNNGTQKPAVWPAIATFDDGGNDPGDPTTDTIDEVNNPKGSSFATWMLDPMVKGSTTRDAILMQNKTARNTCSGVDETKGEQWVKLDPANNPSGATGSQMLQFETPNEKPDARCGKVVFSDMHVSGGPAGDSYPSSCGSATTLTAQEKALAFMFFDISSCVGAIF